MPPKQPGCRAPPQQHPPCLILQPEMHPVAHRTLPCRSAPGQLSRNPAPHALARPNPGAYDTARRGRRAHRCPQIEQRLSEIGRAFPCLRRAPQPLRRVPQRRLRPGQRLRHREHPRDDPLHIAIHRHPRHTERNGRDRRRRVPPDAWQPRQRVWVSRHSRPSDDPSTSMQVARPCVVAKPSPGGHHILDGRRRQIPHRREPTDEPPIMRYDGGDRGLLQHDLGQPDPVRVRRLARLGPPRQSAAVPVIPV